MSSIIDQIRGQRQPNLGTTIHEDVDAMRIELQKLREESNKPFIFLKSSRAALSSNVAVDVMIYQGPPVPVGYRGVVTDFNLFFTTVAGTVRWVITDSRGQVLVTVVPGIAATQNGQGGTVLEEGQSFAVVGQTAGAGVFDTYCSGYIKKVN